MIQVVVVLLVAAVLHSFRPTADIYMYTSLFFLSLVVIAIYTCTEIATELKSVVPTPSLTQIRSFHGAATTR